MTFYRRNLPHLQRDNQPHFVTFCTHQRWVLPQWARSIVLTTCQRGDGWTMIVHGLVVMPDHVHIIFTPAIDQATRKRSRCGAL